MRFAADPYRVSRTINLSVRISLQQPPSLLGRALVALMLTVGFYVLAVGLSFALVILPYGVWKSTGHLNAQLTIFCAVSALLIMYSIAPRIDRFIAPGPRLGEADHPRLFELIRSVSDATGQGMPAEVYLVPDLNAWVANRGGLLGIGSRRIMGLGLPAFHTLSTRQFAAVIAHEFGHYHQGDVALGPLLYRVRQSIARTLHALEERSNILQILFNWYGQLFMRVTTAISRRQEYGADALAARIAGRDPLSTGLETIHSASPIYDGYWGTEVLPVLISGKRPRIGDGFRRFSSAPRVRDATASILNAAMEAPDDPFDTHPPLARRLAAVADFPAQGTLPLPDDQAAIDLLGSVDEAEAALLCYLIADESRRPDQTVEWDDVGRDVWIPIWQERVDEASVKLAGIRCGDVAAVAADPGHLAVRMGFAASSRVAMDQHRYNAAVLFGSALALVLLQRGGTLRLEIGDDPVVESSGVSVKPFLVCRELESGEISASDWFETCQRLGIADTDLAEAVTLVPG